MNTRSEPLLDAAVKRTIEEIKKGSNYPYLRVASTVLYLLAVVSLMVSFFTILYVCFAPEIKTSHKVYISSAIILATPVNYVLLRALEEASHILLNLSKSGANQPEQDNPTTRP